MRLTATALLLTLILPAAAGAAGRPAAGGALDAIAPDGTRLGGCPLEHTDVAVDVSGFVARVAVTQVFATRSRTRSRRSTRSRSPIVAPSTR